MDATEIAGASDIPDHDRTTIGCRFRRALTMAVTQVIGRLFFAAKQRREINHA
jgi:hypothetical protein